MVAPGVPPAAVAAVRQHGRVASVYQTLTPQFCRWADGESAVAYVRAHRWPGGGPVWVAAGEPIGPLADVERAARAFAVSAQRAGARALWFGAERPERLGRGWVPLVVGAQPVWRAGRWPDVLASKPSLRAQVNRAVNKGVRVEEWEAARAGASPALRRILRAWAARRGMPPLSFLADPFVLDRLVDRRPFVAVQSGVPVAYLVLAPIPARGAWHVEWLIRAPHAPNGTASLLLDAAFRAVGAADRVTLGLVPLSTYAPLSDPAPGPAVRALLAWTRAHGRRFYNFEGLERFKAKFQPDVWEPLYLVGDAPAGLDTLYAVADAFAGPRGPLRLVGRALADAAVDETRAGLRRLPRGGPASGVSLRGS